jgi:hypothetical protein
MTRVSHYEPRSNRCYVQTSSFSGDGMQVQINLIDGQTGDLLISVEHKDKRPIWAMIYMEDWKRLADSFGDPLLTAGAVARTPDPARNPAIAQALMTHLMKDERLQER